MNKKIIARIRIGLLVTWLVLAVILLLLIQYGRADVEVQRFVTRLIWVYIFSVFVVIGVMEWLKKKLCD